jgi:hypothetical protein
MGRVENRHWVAAVFNRRNDRARSPKVDSESHNESCPCRVALFCVTRPPQAANLALSSGAVPATEYPVNCQLWQNRSPIAADCRELLVCEARTVWIERSVARVSNVERDLLERLRPSP